MDDAVYSNSGVSRSTLACAPKPSSAGAAKRRYIQNPAWALLRFHGAADLPYLIEQEITQKQKPSFAGRLQAVVKAVTIRNMSSGFFSGVRRAR